MDRESWITQNSIQELSQDLETGCPKFGNPNILGCPIFQVWQKYTEITIINMYLLILK